MQTQKLGIESKGKRIEEGRKEKKDGEEARRVRGVGKRRISTSNYLVLSLCTPLTRGRVHKTTQTADRDCIDYDSVISPLGDLYSGRCRVMNG